MPRTQLWNYPSELQCLSYIQAMVSPDLTFAVQQYSCFCSDPKQNQVEVVKQICCCLLKTEDQGLLLNQDCSQGLECFMDADWDGNTF